ncbi:hypothetical protein [Anabaena sp. CS-542/02]|nr:hypothetical protein [Anabaena sp. CS-542/02]
MATPRYAIGITREATHNNTSIFDVFFGIVALVITHDIGQLR